MKKLLLYSSLLMYSLSAAKPVNDLVAIKVAKDNFKLIDKTLRSNDIRIISKGNNINKSFQQNGVNGYPAYYIIGVNKNFIIVSGDDNVMPIIGYSNQGYSQDNISLKGYLSNITEEIDYAATHSTRTDAKITDAWNNAKLGSYDQIRIGMQSNSMASRSAAKSPMLKTQWNQSPYYNKYTPTIGGYTTPSGCVVTAYTQVMKYYNWPTTGVGSHSYYDSTSGYSLSTNFNKNYDWNNMPNSLNYYSSSSQVEAIARLTIDAGIAVNMSYSTSGSGAWTTGHANSASYAMKNYFKYDTKEYNRSDYSDATWLNMMLNELDAGRPIVYAGSSSGGGHAFVLDGYNTNNYIHVNWGWGGMSDGYFILTGLNPSSLGTGGGAGGGYNQYNSALFATPNNNGSLIGDSYEINNTASTAYDLNGAFNGAYSITRETNGANIHTSTDVDYYKLTINSSNTGYSFKLNINVDDASYASDGNAYTLDTNNQFSLDNGVTWSSSFGDYATNIPANAGNVILVKVSPKINGNIGTYKLRLNLIATPIVNPNSVTLNPDSYESNNTASTAYDLNGAFNGAYSITRETNGANIHTSSDVDYYKVMINPYNTGYDFNLDIDIQDKSYATDGVNYTLETINQYSLDNGYTWSNYFYDFSKGIPASAGNVILVKVSPRIINTTGTYKLNIKLTASPKLYASNPNVNTEAVKIYPNPASGYFKVPGNPKEVTIYDLSGRIIQRDVLKNTIYIKNIKNGEYLVNIIDENDKKNIQKVIIKN